MILMNHEPQTTNIKSRARLRWLAGLLGVFAIAGAIQTGAQTNTNTNATSTTAASADAGPTYDSFQIISRRNIFDPNRSGYRRDDRPRQNRARVNYFGLVGTMSYAKGKFAFFDGTDSEYRKVLEPGGSIAGYTVTGITNQVVTLAADGKEIEMKVGAQLRKEDGGAWHLSTQAEQQPTNTDSETDSAEAATSSTPPAGDSPEANDVLKRLMERRQQELK